MRDDTPDEIVAARLRVEEASTALVSLLQCVDVVLRADTLVASDAAHEACRQLRAAKTLLTKLETRAAAYLRAQRSQT